MGAKIGTLTGYDRSRMAVASAVVVLAIAAVLLPDVLAQPDPLTFQLLMQQDIWLAPLFVAFCFLRFRPAESSPPKAIANETRLVMLCLMALLLVCWTGHYLAFANYEISRDEQLVAFDAEIFRRGALVWPIAPDWQHLANALNRKFMLPIGAAEAWVSGYLPVNAALHALVGSIVDDDLTAPILVAAGGFFLWRITGRVWPDSRTARLATLAFYLGSSQIVITGMTKFAMSGHLAFNLAWLWLFLRDTPRSHAAAMAVGFLSTGLHQPLFHPLFVLPFLALLMSQRRWRLLAVYSGAYAAISLFWLAWPLWIATFGTGPLVPIKTTEIGFVDRLLAVLKAPDLQSLWLMSANLLRFVTWQHPLLVPMALFGTVAAWRAEPLARALAVGFILPIVVMWILLPWQGGGWGYRYVHPVMGNAVLLGGYGVDMLQRRVGAALERPLVWTSAAAIFLLVPLHGLLVNRLAAPRAAKERIYAALDRDLLISDERVSDDFIHNRPDLSNRPIRLLAPAIKPEQVAALCAGRSMTFLDPAPPVPPSERQQALKAAAIAAGCDARQMHEPST